MTNRQELQFMFLPERGSISIAPDHLWQKLLHKIRSRPNLSRQDLSSDTRLNSLGSFPFHPNTENPLPKCLIHPFQESHKHIVRHYFESSHPHQQIKIFSFSFPTTIISCLTDTAISTVMQ